MEMFGFAVPSLLPRPFLRVIPLALMHAHVRTHITTHTHTTHLLNRDTVSNPTLPPSHPGFALLVLRRLSLLLMPVFLPWFLSVFFGLLITSLPPSPRLSGPTVHRKASTRAPTPLRPGQRTREKCASRTPTTCASSLTACDGTFPWEIYPHVRYNRGSAPIALYFPSCCML